LNQTYHVYGFHKGGLIPITFKNEMKKDPIFHITNLFLKNLIWIILIALSILSVIFFRMSQCGYNTLKMEIDNIFRRLDNYNAADGDGVGKKAKPLVELMDKTLYLQKNKWSHYLFADQYQTIDRYILYTIYSGKDIKDIKAADIVKLKEKIFDHIKRLINSADGPQLLYQIFTKIDKMSKDIPTS
jgi:hypothetical protein